MAAELFPTKKPLPSHSASSSNSSIQQLQQHNAAVNNNNHVSAANKGGSNWQGLFPTIRERSVGRRGVRVEQGSLKSKILYVVCFS